MARQEAAGKAMMAMRKWLVVFALVLANSVFAAPGDLDVSFGGAGKITLPVGPENDFIHAVIQQSDGKILVAGVRYTNDAGQWVVARCLESGELDTTFGVNGYLVPAFSGSSIASSIIQQQDGKIVIGGVSPAGTTLMRYGLDGTVDTSFGVDGAVTQDLGSGSGLSQVIQQADGKLVVVGTVWIPSYEDVFVARFNADGSLDTGFNGSGYFFMGPGFDKYGEEVIQKDDGKLVVSVSSSEDGAKLLGLNSDGSLDENFGNGGIVNINIKNWFSPKILLRQPNGKIVVSGEHYLNEDTSEFILARYTENGDIDKSFGVNGFAHARMSERYNEVMDVVQQDDGKLLVVGNTLNGKEWDVSVIRYQMNGKRDANFGRMGLSKAAWNSGHDLSYSGFLQRDGKLLVAGSRENSMGDLDFSVWRYETDSLLRGGAHSGHAVAFAGDFNKDGYGDYVIGISGSDQSEKDGGRAEVISGKDGSILKAINGAAEKDALGTAVAGNADIDNDGFDDVVLGAPNAGVTHAGSVMIAYGPNGSRTRIINGTVAKSAFGSAVALGDVNGDNHADILVGAPKDDDIENGIKDAGSVTVISGNGFSGLKTFYGKTAKANAGSNIASGDINGDGNADIIIGAPNDGGAGSIVVYDLAGTELLKKIGETAKAQFGRAVASGDVDGDGYADVLVGAPMDDNTASALKDAGSVTVFSGNGGAFMVKKYGAATKANFGNSVAAGDVNGDGKTDLVAGAWKDDKLAGKVIKDAGSVSVFSGSGYTQIGGTQYGDLAKDYFGAAVSAGDINSDGNTDLIIGIPGFDLPVAKPVKDVGKVTVLSGAGL